jgi:hypothetical protein
MKLTIAGCGSAVPLRQAVAKLTGLRFTPELQFRRKVDLDDELRMQAAWQMLEAEMLETKRQESRAADEGKAPVPRE